MLNLGGLSEGKRKLLTNIAMSVLYFMEPDGRLSRFDNTLHDRDSAGTAEAASSCRHPAPNVKPRHPPTHGCR